MPRRRYWIRLIALGAIAAVSLTGNVWAQADSPRTGMQSEGLTPFELSMLEGPRNLDEVNGFMLGVMLTLMSFNEIIVEQGGTPLVCPTVRMTEEDFLFELMDSAARYLRAQPEPLRVDRAAQVLYTRWASQFPCDAGQVMLPGLSSTFAQFSIRMAANNLQTVVWGHLNSVSFYSVVASLRTKKPLFCQPRETPFTPDFMLDHVLSVRAPGMSLSGLIRASLDGLAKMWPCDNAAAPESRASAKSVAMPGAALNSTVSGAATMYFMMFMNGDREQFHKIIYPPQLAMLSESGPSSAAGAFDAYSKHLDATITSFRTSEIDVSEMENFDTETNFHTEGSVRYKYSFTPDKHVTLIVEKNGDNAVWGSVFIKQHSDGKWYVVLIERMEMVDNPSAPALSDVLTMQDAKNEAAGEVFRRFKMAQTFAQCAAFYNLASLDDGSAENSEENRALFEDYLTAALLSAALEFGKSATPETSSEYVKTRFQMAVVSLTERAKNPDPPPLAEPYKNNCKNTRGVVTTILGSRSKARN